MARKLLKNIILALAFSGAAVNIAACSKSESEVEQERLDKEKAVKLRLEADALAKENAKVAAAAKAAAEAEKEAALQNILASYGYTKVEHLHGGLLKDNGRPSSDSQGEYAQCYKLQNIQDNSIVEGCLTDAEPRKLFAVRMSAKERQRLFLEGQGYKLVAVNFQGLINIVGEPANNGVQGTCMLLEKTDDSTLHTGCVIEDNKGYQLSALRPLVRNLKTMKVKQASLD